MGIGSILSNVVNYAAKNPKTTAVLTTGGIGLAALVGYKAATTTPKQANDQVNYMLLTNPMLNPLGWFTHAVNPNNSDGLLDGPIVKHLSSQEKIREFYKNGGKGVNFDGVA